MADLNGINVAVYVSASAAGANTALDGQKNGSLSRSTNVIDITTRSDAGVTASVHNNNGWNVSADGSFTADSYTGAGYAIVRAAILARTPVWVVLSGVHGTTASGQSVPTAYNISASKDNSLDWSMEFVGSGALTIE